MARTLFNEAKVDRTAFGREPLDSQGHNPQFWWKQSPLKRLEALELLRQINYDYDPDTARLSRLHRPVKRKAR